MPLFWFGRALLQVLYALRGNYDTSPAKLPRRYRVLVNEDGAGRTYERVPKSNEITYGGKRDLY